MTGLSQVSIIKEMISQNYSISDAARLFADSLSAEKYFDRQEALRFARWFGENRPALEIKPSDLEAYVETYGASSPNASARAEALKSFLAYAHKKQILPTRLVSHVRVRKPTGRRGMSDSGSQGNEVQLTSAGRSTLETELEQLRLQRPRIADDLRTARADGDVKENAPLDAAREAQGLLEARIREIEATLNNAVIVEHEAGPGSMARIGARVVICNIQTGTQLSYQLVNAAEAKPGTGRLSVDSPVGHALLGKRTGDEVQVMAPSGVVFFRIEGIEL